MSFRHLFDLEWKVFPQGEDIFIFDSMTLSASYCHILGEKTAYHPCENRCQTGQTLIQVWKNDLV